MTRIGFGIDVGGSGIKGARVDLDTGEFIGERIKIFTPQPATPDAVAATCAEIVKIAEWPDAVGITLPSVIKNKVVLSAANIDPSWVGIDSHELFAKSGAVMMLTFGTGIGSALLIDGVVFPNTELGHMIVDGQDAENIASSRIKDVEELSYKKWAARVDKVMHEYERLFNPTVFVVGGGISRKADKWVPLLTIETPVVPAQLRNRAGIVGAAMAVEAGLHP